MNFSVVILAGGESSRMGRDKAWIEIDGQPLISHAIATAREAGATEILISGRPGIDYSALGCAVLLDRESGLGPLGGIERALETTQASLMLVLAVDLPGIPAAHLKKLLSQARPGCGVVPENGAFFEPLCAVYPVEARGEIRFDGDASLQRIVRKLAAQDRIVPHVVTEAERPLYRNLNTPADLAAFCPR